MSDANAATFRETFSSLHASGTFLMPNAWDIGSALILQSLGFEAIATTSSGLAASLGRHDQTVSLSELAVHVADLCSVLDIPLSVDAEAGYAAEVDGLSRSIGALSAAGASGVSIEDYMPDRGVLELDEATERVGRFAEAAAGEGMTVTARAENHLYGVDDLDETITRLRSYRDAGADVVYAPGLVDPDQIARVITDVDAPVNVLLLPDGPNVEELRRIGVRRLSTGGALAFAAFGKLAEAGRELLGKGTTDYLTGVLSQADRDAAFGER